jgi:hypothetical protein
MQYLMGQFKENFDGPSSTSESTHHKTVYRYKKSVKLCCQYKNACTV